MAGVKTAIAGNNLLMDRFATKNPGILGTIYKFMS
jgi:hypothetical protein